MLKALPLAAALLFAASCSPAKPDKCGPTTCASGCCDFNGVCQIPSASACGASGNLCATCFGNQVCNFGICVSNAGGGGGSGGGTGGGVTGGGTGGGVTGGGTGGGVTGGGTGGGVTGGGTGGGVTGGGTGGGAGTCSVSCAGCCQGNTCITAVSTTTCGFGGSTCAACAAGTADNCDNGSCQCGFGAPCGAGSRCVGSTCVCDATSCPGGCCAGDSCVTVPTTSACGLSGSQCQACDTTTANNCGSGSCRCGTGAACGAGTRCFNSTCVCDATSCPLGCCSGSSCIAPGTVGQCGTNGGTCAACDAQRADNCGLGGCRCGSGPQCGVGVNCVSGGCGGAARSWTLVTTSGAISARTGPGMAYDTIRARVVLFGGQDSSSTKLSDTWEYNSATATWTQRVVTGPSVRSFPCMVFDPLRNVTVLFGGYNGSTAYNDTWEFNGTTWTQRSPVNAPTARYFHGCWWDSARSRVGLFGGSAASSSTIFSDTWEWDGTNWTQRTLTGAPTRAAHTVAYDTGRQRMVFHAGYASGGASTGTWELGTAWQQTTPTNPPPASYGAAEAFDPVSGTVVVVGGLGTSTFAGAWSYDGLSWTTLSSNIGPRSHGNMVFDWGRGKLIHFGGYSNGSTAVGDTWEY